MEEKIEAIKKVSKVLSKQSVTAFDAVDTTERVAPNKEKFQTLMDPGQQAQEQQMTRKIEESALTVQKTESTSIMDEMKKLNTKVGQLSNSKLTPEDLRNQAKEIIVQMEDVKTRLAENPNANIKSSYQTVLRNRLTHIDDNLKIALSKAGVEYTPPVQTTPNAKSNPIAWFIGSLTDGQQRLDNLSSYIEKISANHTQLAPGDMLLIQMKMGFIQWEVEMFTSTLNKALESTKTLMNVQV